MSLKNDLDAAIKTFVENVCDAIEGNVRFNSSLSALPDFLMCHGISPSEAERFGLVEQSRTGSAYYLKFSVRDQRRR
jgi:hypothetical protein